MAGSSVSMRLKSESFFETSAMKEFKNASSVDEYDCSVFCNERASEASKKRVGLAYGGGGGGGGFEELFESSAIPPSYSEPH